MGQQGRGGQGMVGYGTQRDVHCHLFCFLGALFTLNTAQRELNMNEIQMQTEVSSHGKT